MQHGTTTDNCITARRLSAYNVVESVAMTTTFSFNVCDSHYCTAVSLQFSSQVAQ